jgi:hypothetical protein
MEQVCHYADLANYYGFAAAEYATGDETASGNNQIYTFYRTYGKYDMNSIMHYTSYMAIGASKDKSQVKDLVLAKWKNGGSNFVPPPEGVTPQNAEPFDCFNYVSEGDYAAICYLYPWRTG